jgi:hypothetical protein
MAISNTVTANATMVTPSNAKHPIRASLPLNRHIHQQVDMVDMVDRAGTAAEEAKEAPEEQVVKVDQAVGEALEAPKSEVDKAAPELEDVEDKPDLVVPAETAALEDLEQKAAIRGLDTKGLMQTLAHPLLLASQWPSYLSWLFSFKVCYTSSLYLLFNKSHKQSSLQTNLLISTSDL